MNQKQEFIQNEMELVNSMIEGDLSWEEYMPHYQGLADDEKPIAAYLLAMGGKSSGHGFMRRLQADRDVKYPFMFSGWAGKHNDLGPMFQITRECFFLEEDPLLFYTDDDLIYCGPKYQSDAQYLAEQIEKHSSGERCKRSDAVYVRHARTCSGHHFPTGFSVYSGNGGTEWCADENIHSGWILLCIAKGRRI